MILRNITSGQYLMSIYQGRRKLSNNGCANSEFFEKSLSLLTQPNLVRFSKFLFLLKAYENRHHFLFYKELPNIDRLSSTRLRSDEGHQRHLYRAKFENFQFMSYRYVIYLKRKLRTCRIQNQAEKV